MMRIWAPDRRWLSLASLSTLLVAALHTAGQFAPAPPDPQLYAVKSAMRGVRLALGLGMAPSVWELFQSLTFTMSITVAALGVVGLVVAGASAASPALVRRTAGVLGATHAALTLLYSFYGVPPARQLRRSDPLYVMAMWRADLRKP